LTKNKIKGEMADSVVPGFSSSSRDFWDFHRTPEILGFSSYFKDYYGTPGIFRDSESRETAISPLYEIVLEGGVKDGFIYLDRILKKD
jgi:hypothetical protein